MNYILSIIEIEEIQQKITNIKDNKKQRYDFGADSHQSTNLASNIR